MCLDWLKPPIISMCSSGHSICGPCFAQVEGHTCVVCKEFNVMHRGLRNIPMEGLVATLKPTLTCPHCDTTTKYDDAFEHRLTCPNVPCMCPYDGCDELVQRSEIIQHLERAHSFRQLDQTHDRLIIRAAPVSRIAKIILRYTAGRRRQHLMLCIRYSRGTVVAGVPDFTVQAVYLGDDFDHLDVERHAVTICYKQLRKNPHNPSWNVATTMTTKVNVVPWSRPFTRTPPYVHRASAIARVIPFCIPSQGDDETFELYVSWGARKDGVVIHNHFFNSIFDHLTENRRPDGRPGRSTDE